MSQQINLYTPILLTQRRYFSARAMAAALAVFVLGLAGLGALLGHQADQLQAELEATRRATQADRERLAVALGQAPSALGDAALQQELDGLRAEADRLERQRDTLGAGLVRAGRSHSAALRLLARTLPATAWLRDVRLDGATVMLTGYTLEPAALHGWITALQSEPLLDGRALRSLKVQQQAAGESATARTVWQFSLENGGPP